MQEPCNADRSSSQCHRKSRFSQEEDQKLISLVSQYGDLDWKTISSHMDGRNVRQCRERWNHYLSPKVRNDPWSKIEDILLYQKYDEYGPNWIKIAEYFPYRTYINVKNRFLLLQRQNERFSTQIIEIANEIRKKWKKRQIKH